MNQFYSLHDLICHSFHLHHVTFSKLQEVKSLIQVLYHTNIHPAQFEILRCHSSSLRRLVAAVVGLGALL